MGAAMNGVAKGIALLAWVVAVPALPGSAQAPAPTAAAAPGPLGGEAIDPAGVTCRDIAALRAEDEAYAAEFAMDLIDIFFAQRGIAVTEESIDRGFAAIEEGCRTRPPGTVWRLLQAAF